MGVLPSARGRPGAGMEWRVTIELNGADGTKQTQRPSQTWGVNGSPGRAMVECELKPPFASTTR